MKTREQLLEALECASRFRALSKFQRLTKSPFATLKSAGLGRLVRHFFGGRKSLHVKAKVFFGQELLIPIPPFEDIWLHGVALDEAEIRLAKFLLVTLQERDIFFDIGGHVGYYTALAAQCIGRDGALYAFEPCPSVIEILRQNVKSLRNVHVVEKAFGQAEDTVDFHMGSGKFVANSTINPGNLVESGFSELGRFQTLRVETTTLDTFCLAQRIVPTFLKIDVEGAEEQVLLGAKELLTRHSPTIAMEVWLRPLTENYKRAVALLGQHHFMPFMITPQGTLAPLRTEALEEDWLALQGPHTQKDLDNLIFRKVA